MPIYELYCEKCHTVFNFFSPRVNTEKEPDCPCCKTVSLPRQTSVFSDLSGDRADQSGTEGGLAVDAAKMEKAMAMLVGEVGNLDENDSWQVVMLIRKFSKAMGMNMVDAMKEMLALMEAGEDPDEIEARMGDNLKEADPFSPKQEKKISRRSQKPRVDEKLYYL